MVEKNQNTFEDCLTRVPFVFKPPAGRAVENGVRRDALVELVDLPATIYDLSEVDPGYNHFGQSQDTVGIPVHRCTSGTHTVYLCQYI